MELGEVVFGAVGAVGTDHENDTGWSRLIQAGGTAARKEVDIPARTVLREQRMRPVPRSGRGRGLAGLFPDDPTGT